ncbi:MAG: hypothetical protein KBT20_08450 [Bacteroidales bacterium]|nr:hypothetical protein [Candidatus Liminaster caballi]
MRHKSMAWRVMGIGLAYGQMQYLYSHMQQYSWSKSLKEHLPRGLTMLHSM